MANRPHRFVGNSDFHDGYIRDVSWNNDRVRVVVEGDSGNHYTVAFDGVYEIESHSPVNMMLYALSEADTDGGLSLRYDFVNWYCDEPDKEESKACLRIVANAFTVTESK